MVLAIFAISGVHLGQFSVVLYQHEKAQWYLSLFRLETTHLRCAIRTGEYILAAAYVGVTKPFPVAVLGVITLTLPARNTLFIEY